MLAEKDLDIVLHRYARPLARPADDRRGRKQGADVYVQKPISIDVVEGQAMQAAARKHGRVVQVGLQRRSTPHLIEARDKIIREGKLGRVGLVEIYCYYHMRAGGNPPDKQPPEYLDYEMWTGPAPMRPYNQLVHPRGWRGFTEYGNGIIGDMCVHMLDATRWMLGLRLAEAASAARAASWFPRASKANISDTQTATFDFGDLPVVWNHRTWGPRCPDPKYPWAMTFYGEKGTLKASVFSYDFTPEQRPFRTSQGRDLRGWCEQVPRRRDREGTSEIHVAPGDSGAI